MMKRFVLVPGYVTSKNDGELHYVSVHALARLYGLNIEDCTVSEYGEIGVEKACCTVFSPDPTGRYDLPIRDWGQGVCYLCQTHCGMCGTFTTEGFFCERCLKIVVSRRASRSNCELPWWE